MPYRTLYTCPDPSCDWSVEWPHPDEGTMRRIANEVGVFEAPHVLMREASRQVEEECERHFMDHMRGAVGR